MRKTKLVAMSRIGAWCVFLSAGSWLPQIVSAQTAVPEAPAPAVTPADAQSSKPDAEPQKQQDRIKVAFDDANPGVIYVESNGERVRIDVNKKLVEPAPSAVASVTDSAAAPQPQPSASPVEDSPYIFGEGEEPYDWRLINVPTPKKVPKGTWNIDFTHRFTQPLHPLDESARNLLGLDSFAAASFGVKYGITDKFFASVYRSPLCQRGLCRTIEIGFGYNFLEHDEDSPFALQAYGSVEGNGNFTEEYTYNLQARMSLRLGKRGYLFFSPAIHLNSNGSGRFDPRATDFFPPATVAEDFRLPTNGASYGFGGSILITPNLLAVFEFTPRTGFMLGRSVPVFDKDFNVIAFRHESEPEVGFGIQRNIGKHSFALTFSNTQTTTTSRYNSSNLVLKPQRLIIGFNLSRRF